LRKARRNFGSGQGLAAHAAERDLIFLSSPFSVEAVDLLERVGVPAWKIASGEVTNFQMFERMAETGKPILLSAGMSDWAEQEKIVNFIQELDVALGLFQCTTAYPCPPEEVGLNLMAELRERYDLPVGLSDHTGKIYSGLAAASLGANMIEVHVTLSREMYGTSVDASLTTEELSELVEGVRFIETMQATPVDKDEMAKAKAHLRPVFFRSVVMRDAMKAGSKLEKADMTTKKPGTGISAELLNDLVGRELAKDVSADQLLREEDLV
jgi:N-acetylneuraminate synthase